MKKVFDSFVKFGAIAMSFLLAACSGSGDGGNSVGCGFMDATANAGVSAGSFDNTEAATDGNLGSAASISSFGSGFIRARGPEFSAGDNPGILLSAPAGTTAADMTVRTYLGNAVVESATGPTLTVTDTQGRTVANDYVSFEATVPFDGVEFLFTDENNEEFLIFEICGFSDV